MLRRIVACFMAIALVTGGFISAYAAPALPVGLEISFNFVVQPGRASNQFAVWIEDVEGNCVKTLYATRFTAAGGYQNRPDSLAMWVEKADLSALSKADVDAVTGTTPSTSRLAYTWDFTDTNGNPVPNGVYRFCIEGTLRWKNWVLYTGIVKVGEAAEAGVMEASFHYEASGDQPALHEQSPENTMIGAASARLVYGE